MGACVRHHHHYYLRGKQCCPALRCLRTVCMLGRCDKYGRYASGVVQYFFNEPGVFGFEFSKKSDNISYERSHWYSRSFEGIKNIIIFKLVIMR